jgi:hypothetical protein
MLHRQASSKRATSSSIVCLVSEVESVVHKASYSFAIDWNLVTLETIGIGNWRKLWTRENPGATANEHEGFDRERQIYSEFQKPK